MTALGEQPLEAKPSHLPIAVGPMGDTNTCGKKCVRISPCGHLAFIKAAQPNYGHKRWSYALAGCTSVREHSFRLGVATILV